MAKIVCPYCKKELAAGELHLGYHQACYEKWLDEVAEKLEKKEDTNRQKKE